MSIEDWRLEIDAIDSELLGLLNKRASLAVKVGQSKRLMGVELYDPTREQEVIERARRANPGPLDEEAIMELFGCIIRESRRIEACAMEREQPGQMSDIL
jgi:chorismate mutase